MVNRDDSAAPSHGGFVARAWRHLWCDDRTVARHLTPTVLDAVEQAIADEERIHSAELRFVIEADLDMAQLWAGVTPRQRALDVFASLGVWDTEHNTGVLLYVLWADHAAEVVADRGIAARVPQQEWDAVVASMTRAFAEKRYAEGAVEAVRRIGALLAERFPATQDAVNPNELPNRPTLL